MIHPFEGDTAIFITPGYRFKAACADAIAQGYRVYGYGASSQLLPKG